MGDEANHNDPVELTLYRISQLEKQFGGVHEKLDKLIDDVAQLKGKTSAWVSMFGAIVSVVSAMFSGSHK